jgi:hypothetical protein
VVFSHSTPPSSTTKTGRHDIAEIMLKVALSKINQSINVFSFGCGVSIIIGILCILFQDTFGPKIMMYFFLIYHICFSEPRTEKYQAHVSEQISNIHKSNY